MKINAKLEMHSPAQIMRDKGLTSNGSVQAFHTQNVLRRLIKYMPYRSGMLIKQAIVQTNINSPYIKVQAPQAKYLYYGHVMVGKAPKSVTDIPLNYTKTKNPKAGPFWDKALKSAEGTVITRELQNYINRRGGSR